jgi:spore coat protein A
VNLIPAKARVHAAMPETDFWSYGGSVPGPTVSAEAGQRIRVKFLNELFTVEAGKTVPARIPFSSYTAIEDTADPSMNWTGSEKAVPGTVKKDALDTLTGWTVTHLHGAPAHGDSDGWTDNVAGPGEITEKVYDFPEEKYWIKDAAGNVKEFAGGIAPTLWYHDHGMGVTRFNVYSGLAGMWLMRHPKEKELGLPVGAHELPLVVQDRNFETTDGSRDGNLTGRLLHKVQADVMECFCPATLVNGRLWPHSRVGARLHRLRIVNGSNARFYRFHFTGLKTADQAEPDILPSQFVQQIGTDGGLLAQAVALPEAGVAGAGCLLLAPGERADVLVDFGGIKKAGWNHVAVYNSAPAPYGAGAELKSVEDIHTGNGDELRPYPAVMRFDVTGEAHPAAIAGKPLLGAAFHRIAHDELQTTGHEHTLIALREEDGMLFLHEMMEKTDADDQGLTLHHGGITIVLPEKQHDGSMLDVTYVSVAKRFNDTTTVCIQKGSWRVWRIINLSPDTHPFHIHLVQFQGLKRFTLTPDGASPFPAASDSFKFQPAMPASDMEENERGWKDTIRVNPGERDDNDDLVSVEMLTLAAQFTGHAGRYMYHCHILEHEDQEMMRPFLVVPEELMKFMGGHSHGH